MRREYNDVYGIIRIGQIDSINTDAFTCNINFLGSYSSAKNVPFNPHPLLGMMPSVGSMVVVYDNPGYGKRVLMPLYEREELTVEQLQERPTQSGLVPDMREGEIYIGRHGRAYFDNSGNVRIESEMARSGLELKSEKARAELYGYNFNLYTMGNNVRIRSISTVSTGPLQTWGDSLSLEVNIPIAPGLDSAPEVIPTNLGKISIDKLGSVNMDVSSKLLNFKMDAMTGLISIGRGTTKLIGVEVGPISDAYVSMFSPMGELFVSSDGLSSISSTPGKSSLELAPDSGITLTNTIGTISIDPDGRVGFLGPNGSIELMADGSLSMLSNTLDWGISADSGGNLAFTGNNVDISAGTTSTLSGDTSIILRSPSISLGLIPMGHVAIAEAIVAELQKLNTTLQAMAIHTHVISGIVTSGPGSGGAVAGQAQASLTLLASGLVPLVPLASTIGSTTVTAQA